MSRELRRKTPEESLRECQAEEKAAGRREGISRFSWAMRPEWGSHSGCWMRPAVGENAEKISS